MYNLYIYRNFEAETLSQTGAIELEREWHFGHLTKQGLPSTPKSFGFGHRSRRCLPAKKNVGGILSGSLLPNSGPVFA